MAQTTQNFQDFSKSFKNINPNITDQQLQDNFAAAGGVITPKSLTPVNPIPIAPNIPAPIDTTGIASDINLGVSNAQATVDAENAKAKELSASKSTLESLLGGKSADTTNAYQTSGATDLYNKLKEIQGRSDAISASSNPTAIEAQQQDKALAGSTRTSNNIVGADILRTNALKQLSLGQEYAITSGNFEKAKTYADNIINAKYGQMEADIKAKQTNLESILKFDLAPAEKKLAEATQAKLTKEANDLAEKKALAKLNVDAMSEYAKYAMEAGQSDIASQISSLDTTKPTFKQDLAKLQAKIKNPTMELDLAIKRANLAKIQKETSLLGEPTAKEKAKTEAALQSAKDSIPATQDKIDAVDALLNASGLSTRVGSNILSRKPTTFGGGVTRTLSVVGIPSLLKQEGKELTGAGQSFAGGVHKLISGLTLQSLIDAKSKGATFGALSDSELNILANSASALNDWEIKDGNGKGTGVWNVDENTFKNELKTIQDLSKKALYKSQGNVLATDEQAILDSAFSPENTLTDPSNYFQ